MIDPTTDEEWEQSLDRTLQRLRDCGWVESYSLMGNLITSVVWTEKGRSGLALLRHMSAELELTKTRGVAVSLCWLAERYGPDIRR